MGACVVERAHPRSGGPDEVGYLRDDGLWSSKKKEDLGHTRLRAGELGLAGVDVVSESISDLRPRGAHRNTPLQADRAPQALGDDGASAPDMFTPSGQLIM